MIQFPSQMPHGAMKTNPHDVFERHCAIAAATLTTIAATLLAANHWKILCIVCICKIANAFMLSMFVVALVFSTRKIWLNIKYKEEGKAVDDFWL